MDIIALRTMICSGYYDWSNAPARDNTRESDFGAWWSLTGDDREFPRWRVSWNMTTGELYACEHDNFILFGVFKTREEVEQAMAGWADPDSPIYHNLTALAEQVAAHRTAPLRARTQTGYNGWRWDGTRRDSRDVDFGMAWALDGDPSTLRQAQGSGQALRWRVSWIATTGELYACRRDQYILLAVLETREEVEAVMDGWADPDSPIYRDLPALLARLAEPRAIA